VMVNAFCRVSKCVELIIDGIDIFENDKERNVAHFRVMHTL